MSAVVVRALGADQAGEFFLGTSLVAMLATVGNTGLEYGVLRYVAPAAAGSHWGDARAYIRTAIRRACITLSLLVVGVFMLGPLIATHVYSKPQLSSVLRGIAPSCLFAGCSLILAYALQAMSRTAQSVAISSFLTPAIVAGAVVAWHFKGAGQLSLVYVGATGTTVIVAYFLQRVATGTESLSTRDFRPQDLVSTGRVYWPGLVANQLLSANGHLLAGIWLATHDVAVLAISLRVAMLMSFMAVAVNFVAAPQFASSHATGDRAVLGSTAVSAARLATAASVPLFVLICLVPDQVLKLFGHDLRGASALVILCFGQLCCAIWGTSGIVMDMAGMERSHRFIILSTTGLSILLLVILTPLFGVIGSAAAISTGIALQNVWQAVRVRRVLGINLVLLRHSRPVRA